MPAHTQSFIYHPHLRECITNKSARKNSRQTNNTNERREEKYEEEINRSENCNAGNLHESRISHLLSLHQLERTEEEKIEKIRTKTANANEFYIDSTRTIHS